MDRAIHRKYHKELSSYQPKEMLGCRMRYKIILVAEKEYWILSVKKDPAICYADSIKKIAGRYWSTY